MKGTCSPTSTGSERCSTPAEPLPPFDFLPLGRVVYGGGTLSRLGDLTRELGGSRVLLVTDPGLAKAGHPQRAIAILHQAGLDAAIFDQVDENPTNTHVEHGTRLARQLGIDCLVAVGGGSAMDCAKGINFLLTNGGTMADYKGFGRAHQPMLPSIGVPTTAGTGSEAQSFALITDDKTHLKMACGDRKAAFRVALLDPELTVSQPRHITALTGIDAIAHAIEAYVCNKRNPLSQMAALSAWRYLNGHFETVLTQPCNLQSRSAMQVGAYFAGLAIENAMLGICHSCANPLTAHYGLTHGKAIGILLPHVIRFNAVLVETLYRDLVQEAHLGNGEPAGEILARRITQLLHAAELPTSLREAGVAQSILPLLAEEASEQWTARFNPRPVHETDLLRVYEMAW